MSLEKLVSVVVLVTLVIGALANFYRNRDPYRAYFHQRADHFLTTHMIDSEIQPWRCLEWRLRGMPGNALYRALWELYRDKQLILPNDTFFDTALLRQALGKEVQFAPGGQPDLDFDMDQLLKKARYSFFYSRFTFSPLAEKAPDSCDNLSTETKPLSFPLMIILLPASSEEDRFVHAIHHGKYFFFIPSNSPVLELTR
jgi:hypothetical protein